MGSRPECLPAKSRLIQSQPGADKACIYLTAGRLDDQPLRGIQHMSAQTSVVKMCALSPDLPHGGDKRPGHQLCNGRPTHRQKGDARGEASRGGQPGAEGAPGGRRGPGQHGQLPLRLGHGCHAHRGQGWMGALGAGLIPVLAGTAFDQYLCTEESVPQTPQDR